MPILDTAVSRTPFGEHDGRSGGSLERVVLAGGKRLVVKRTALATDLTRDSPTTRTAGSTPCGGRGCSTACRPAWITPCWTVGGTGTTRSS
jgi:hypothetical protein